jgi:aerobic carbon-monoxide dehydrogenase small subunit
VLEGKAVKSCLMLAVQADGARILTIEGLAQDGRLHPIQEGFWEKHALQCGFCTPGQMCTIYDLLKSDRRSEEEIREALSGVLCPCTGYVHIVEAVKAARAKLDAMSPQERQKFFPL